MQLADYTIKTMLIGPGMKTPSPGHNLVHGFGETKKEALDDLIRILEVELDIDVSDETPAHEALKVNQHEPALWCLSIRYITVEDQRLERLKKLVSPMKYASSQPDNSVGRIVWETITIVDGSVCINDFRSVLWPSNYHATLRKDKLCSNELYFFMPGCSYSDYSGSTITASNHKYMEDTFVEEAWLHPASNYTEDIVIGVTGLLASDQFEEILRIIEGIQDYPVIDAATFSDFEIDAADEAWDCWAKSDFESALDKEFGEREWPDLREFFEKWRREANVDWYGETGPGVTIDLVKIISEIAKAPVSEWRI